MRVRFGSAGAWLRAAVLVGCVGVGAGFDVFGVHVAWPFGRPRLPAPADALAWSADGRFVVAGVDGGPAIRVDRRGRAVEVPEPGLSHVRLSPEGRLVLGARDPAFVSVDVEGGAVEQMPLGASQGKPVLWLRGPTGDVIVTRTVAHYTVRRTGGRATDADAAPTRNFRDLWLDPIGPLAFLDTGFGLEVRHLVTGLTLRTFDSGRKDQRYVGAARDAAGRLILAAQDAEGFRTWTPPDPPQPPWPLDADDPKALSPDGAVVAVGTDRGVQLYATATRAPLELLKTGAPAGRLAFAPDGTAIAAALRDGRVRTWTLEDLVVPDDPLLVRAPADVDVGRLVVDEAVEPLPLRRPLRAFGLAGATSQLAWRPGGAGAPTAWVGEGLAQIGDDGAVAEIPVQDAVPGRPFAWSGDGAQLAVITDDGVTIVEARRWRVVRRIPTGGGHLRLQWRGERITVDDGPGRARSWSAATGEALGPAFDVSPEATARFVASPDGAWLAVTGREPKVVDAADGAVLAALQAQWAGVVAAAWSPDGRWLATAGGDSTVVLWDTADWRAVRTIEGAHGLELAFAPDSRRLVAATWDGAVVADVEAARPVERLQFEGLLAGLEWGVAGVALMDNAGSLYLWPELPAL